MKTLILIAMIGCTDLPDHDDPREAHHVTATTSCATAKFDGGATSWSGDATAVISTTATSQTWVPIVADSGHFFAWLGVGVICGQEYVAQTFRRARRRRVMRLTASGRRLGRDWLGRRPRCASDPRRRGPARCSRASDADESTLSSFVFPGADGGGFLFPKFLFLIGVGGGGFCSFFRGFLSLGGSVWARGVFSSFRPSLSPLFVRGTGGRSDATTCSGSRYRQIPGTPCRRHAELHRATTPRTTERLLRHALARAENCPIIRRWPRERRWIPETSCLRASNRTSRCRGDRRRFSSRFSGEAVTEF